MKKFFGFNISDELAEYFESDLSTNRDMEDATILLENGIMPYRDGNLWCVLIGENLQSGICGFGITIHEAFVNFMIDVKEMQKRMSSEQPILPEGLDEAAEECIGTLIPEEVYTTTPFAAEYVIKLIDAAFKAGAKWMAEWGSRHAKTPTP